MTRRDIISYMELRFVVSSVIYQIAVADTILFVYGLIEYGITNPNLPVQTQEPRKLVQL